MNINMTAGENGSGKVNSSISQLKEKVMSYEEKSVGSTPFFKCEACPYMALAEDDIKFHLFTAHPDLAKKNGLADNIQITCPGCTSVFEAEETLRTHLRNHHKMGIKDVKKMVKSLVQIALKNAKLKKEVVSNNPPIQLQSSISEMKIPQVIEIIPDRVNVNNDQLPKGVSFISVEELNKMSTPNFEKVDPKEVIQEASINIVYTNDVSTQYVNVSNHGVSSSTCNLIPVTSVTPDLISSVQPRIPVTDINQSPHKEADSNISSTITESTRKTTYTNPEEKGTLCSISNCVVRLKDPNNLAYHRKCHQNGKLQCPECTKKYSWVHQLHMHLWKIHAIDLELPTCTICGYKNYKRHILINVHTKCHGKNRSYTCSICQKKFKTSNQLSKHRMIHKCNVIHQCQICQREFNLERHLREHMAAVHDKLRPFKCGHCSYMAARKCELKLHLRLHTGDKPYACDQCDYCTRDHNSLRRHKLKHSNEGVYKCKYCPYSAIQSTAFASHMISKHPNMNLGDVHCCPFCSFKSVSRNNYVVHLTTHRDKEGIKLLIDIAKSVKNKKRSWTIPSENTEKTNANKEADEKKEDKNSSDNMPIEVYDCDSLPETVPQEYPKNYCTTTSNDTQQSNFNSEVVTDLSKEDNNSDYLMPEGYTIQDRHQYSSQHPLQMSYETPQNNLHFLNPSVSHDQGLLANSIVTSSHSPIINSISNNIMNNFPIRLPPAPISVRNNITLKPVDKIPFPVSKATGPIIKPMQILPVPSSSNSPFDIPNEIDGMPRKKPKISVKSNLILKGPDQVNMFHSQQKMAFKRLEDNERFGLSGPVTFNNLITTQFMQLQPEPTLSESPNTIMTYPQDSMMVESATTPVDNEINDNPQIFSFNQQMNANTLSMIPPPQKVQNNDPSYIKIEATIKQNTQSPSLERMCNANLLNNPAITREYKASPPLEDIHKNMSEIKNEVKSDAFYNMAITNTATNPPIIEQYMIDNIIPEQYPAHLDLSTVVLSEVSNQQNDVIEIDDNSDDNKLLNRFDMNFSLESLYLMQNDFHFLENDLPSNMSEVPVNEMNRMVTEVPIINQKDNLEVVQVEAANDSANFIQGKKDPMMNTSVRPSTNKINVKNIELMKN
ncbi:unnamed protein product [Danaus chrysippus]|uniref:(African queen) hypothetical protein n=1 Tax=Danaus chrysippus TaxID=151541 RepID=A0A8J2W9D4_9NEOP|nr:unnamed protein product [Danaus chrysippus]